MGRMSRWGRRIYLRSKTSIAMRECVELITVLRKYDKA